MSVTAGASRNGRNTRVTVLWWPISDADAILPNALYTSTGATTCDTRVFDCKSTVNIIIVFPDNYDLDVFNTRVNRLFLAMHASSSIALSLNNR